MQISCPSLPFANCDEIDGYLLSAIQHHGLGLLLLLLLFASGNSGNMRERNSIHRFLYNFCLQISVFNDFEQIFCVFWLQPPTHPLTIGRWCSQSFSGYLVMTQLASLSLLFTMKVVMVQHFVSKEGLLEGYVWLRHSIVVIVFPSDLFVVCGDFLCNFIATKLCTNPLSPAPLSGVDEVSVGVMAVSGDFFAIS